MIVLQIAVFQIWIYSEASGSLIVILSITTCACQW